MKTPTAILQKIKKILKSSLAIGAVSLILVVGVIYAWTEPTAFPPGGNVAAPLNVGPTGQSKAGGLILNTGGAATGLIVDKGNVGIGTTAPGYTLDVNGVIRARSDIYLTKGSSPFLGSTDAQDLRLGTGFTERMRITSDGNVGIGTAAPTSKLDVAGFGRFQSSASTPTGNVNAVEIFYYSTSGYGAVAAYNRGSATWLPMKVQGSYVTLDSGMTEVLRATGGNVGIGTASPNSSKGTAGYLDVKDVYLRNVSKWASVAGSPTGWICRLVTSAQVAHTATAFCAADEKVISGGCYVADNAYANMDFYPTATNGYFCQCGTLNAPVKAYAWCCK